MARIDATLEYGPGFDTVRAVGAGYKRVCAADLRDRPAKMTDRQATFYRNLMTIAAALGSNRIPIDFEVVGRGFEYLDRGCIKIAEHAGFIDELFDEDGELRNITLAFDVTGKRSSDD